MNQYTAPMPGHFMWHLFSIPLLGTKSWLGAVALWPISLSQGWGTQSALGFSFWADSSLTEHAFVFSQEFGCISIRRGAKQEKSNCLQLLYRGAVMHFTVSWCIMVVLFLLSSFANIALPLLFWSRALLLLFCLFACLYPSVPFFLRLFVSHFSCFYLSVPHS